MSFLGSLKKKLSTTGKEKQTTANSTPSMYNDASLHGCVEFGPDSNVNEEDHKSTLRVTIVEGRDLPIADIFSSDPNVVCKVNGEQVYKSKTVMSNLNPVYNETFEIQVHETADMLEFEIWDYDTFSSDDFMGKCNVEISNLLRHEELEMERPIGQQGFLRLKICAVNFGRYLDTVIKGPVGNLDMSNPDIILQDDISLWQAAPISKLVVYCAQTITAIRVVYANGATGVTIGSDESGLEREFELESNEFITQITGRASATHVDALQFVTNKGRKSGWLGGFGGIQFSLESNNKRLRSVLGYGSGQSLGQLTAIFEN